MTLRESLKSILQFFFLFFYININFAAVRRHWTQLYGCRELSIQFRTAGRVSQTCNCRSLSDQWQQWVKKRVRASVSALEYSDSHYLQTTCSAEMHPCPIWSAMNWNAIKPGQIKKRSLPTLKQMQCWACFDMSTNTCLPIYTLFTLQLKRRTSKV